MDNKIMNSFTQKLLNAGVELIVAKQNQVYPN